MENHRFILEKYSGSRSRHTCPSCGKSGEFVRYVDQADGSYLDKNVGRCNREESCGYHYTPSQYFADGGERPDGSFLPPRTEPKDPSYMDKKLVSGSMRAYENNSLVQFLLSKYDADKVWKVVNDYKVGTSKHFDNSIVFWQIDQQGRIHAGKVMKYDNTGHRVKTEERALITWVHSILSIKDYNLQQCYFGQHLLKGLPVCIVESEKTALVCAIEVPGFTWIATGGVNGARWSDPSVSSILKDRKVIMYPDAGCAADWRQKAEKIKYINIVVSDMLEKYPEGYDLADYFIDSIPDLSCSGENRLERAGTSPAVCNNDYIPTQEDPPEVIGAYFEKKNPFYRQLIEALDLQYGEPIELTEQVF
jgi:hypothetical protein